MLAVWFTTEQFAFAAFAIAAVASGVAVLTLRRRDHNGALPLAVVLFLDSVWLLTDGLRLLSDELSRALLWFEVQQAVIVFVPVAWLLFVFEYVGREEWVKPRFVAGLCLLPVAAVALTLTNSYHGLFWTDPAFVTNGDLTVLTVTFGPAYWVSAAYVYLLIGVGFVLLGRLVIETRSVYRRQVALVLAAGAFPGVTNVLYFTGTGPVPALDLTPYSVLLEGAIIFYAIFRYRFLDLAPVARATVIENMGDAMVVVDEAWDIVDANPAALELSGVSDPFGHRLDEGFPALTSITDGSSAVGTIAVDPGQEQRPSVASPASAQTAYYDVEVTIIEDHRGEVAGRLVVLSDVTERERRERTLEAIQVASRDLMGTDTVEAVCERSVTAIQEILGLRFTCIHLLQDGVLEPIACTEDVSELYDPVPSFDVGHGLQGTVYETGERRVYEDLTAAEAPLNDTETPLKSAVLLPLGDHGVLGAASDEQTQFDETFLRYAEVLSTNTSVALTRAKRERQLREREQDLEQQNERLDEFASVVSHDLRNPLTVAHGSLEFAREGDAEAFDRLERAIDRMEQLTDDLLDLARQGAESQDVESIALADAARKAWDSVETGDAKLVVSTDATVEADRSQLRQLLENCFRNTMEHGSTSDETPSEDLAGTDDRVDAGDGPRPVTVRVGTLPDGFFVEDDGKGIPEDEREKVFDRGYSGGQGTGLGLSIVEQVARAHGWDVRVTEGELGETTSDPGSGRTPRTSRSGGARFEFRGTDVSNG